MRGSWVYSSMEAEHQDRGRGLEHKWGVACILGADMQGREQGLQHQWAWSIRREGGACRVEGGLAAWRQSIRTEGRPYNRGQRLQEEVQAGTLLTWLRFSGCCCWKCGPGRCCR